MHSHIISLAMIIGSIFLGRVDAQQVPYPTWAKPIQLGGLTLGTPYLPPEYTGTFPHAVEAYFVPTGRRRNPQGVSIKWSPQSGVLAIRDRRQSPTTRFGWDTGLARVYHCSYRSEPGVHPVKLLVTGWNSTTGTSAVIELTVPASGQFTSRSYAPASLANEIWTATSSVEGKLYILDLQSFAVIRFSDTDANGLPDTRDANFSVSLPPAYDPLVPGSDLAVWIHPVDGFSLPRAMGAPLRATGVVDLFQVRQPSGGGPGRQVFIDDVNGTYVLAASPVVSATTELGVIGALVRDQTRIVVTGPAQKAFKVVRITTAGEAALSGTHTLPVERRMFVDLNEKLEGAWQVQAKALDGSLESRTRKVDTRDLAVLFRPYGADLNQGHLFRLEGDKLKAGYVAHYRLDGVESTLDTYVIDTRTVDIKLPVLGDPSANPPYSKGRIIDLWLVDPQTSQVIASPIIVWVLFD